MSSKQKKETFTVGKGDYVRPRPSKADKKKPPTKQEDKYAGWEETFRRDRYGK